MQATTKAQMLFISELNGFKSGSYEDKITHGINCYANHITHELNMDKEDDRAENYENIWLERLYNELDAVHEVSCPMSRVLAIDTENYSDSVKWSVPIELDASASMLQYEGALLGDDRLLRMTNCIVGEEGLTDPWGVLQEVPRKPLKAVFTPDLYGSKQTAKKLLEDTKKYTKDQIAGYVKAINAERKTGPFGLASAFKDFIIDNCQPSAVMHVKIWNEEFVIQCNRFKNLGEYSKFYKVYDSTEKRELIFKNTHTKRIPDLEQFRSYFVTLLVHNLDSQVADIVSKKLYNKYGWVVSIHDAFIVPPQAAEDCRKWYAECITDIYNNRNTILKDYFKSIGITAAAAAEWEKVMAKVVPVAPGFECHPMALK